MFFVSRVFARLFQLACFLYAWGVHSFACLLGTITRPPPELPLSCQTTPSGAEDLSIIRNSKVGMYEQLKCGPPRNFSLSLHNPEKGRQSKKMIHRGKVQAHPSSGRMDKSFPKKSASIISERNDDESPAILFSSTIDHVPSLSNSLTPSPLSSPCPSPTFPSYHEPDPPRYSDEQLPFTVKVVTEIGELGKRRGFKGAPLSIHGTRKYTPFLSLPNLSPRTPASIAENNKPSSPLSPLMTVTNMIRNASNTPTKLVTPVNEISQDLQDCYDQADPFATIADTFFDPSVSFGTVPTVNVNDFGPYYQRDTRHRRTPSLKLKSIFDDLQAATTTRKQFIRTTIYDMSVSSINFPKTSVNRRQKTLPRPSKCEACLSPKIVLTTPSAPSSPTKMNVSIGNPLSPSTRKGTTGDNGAQLLRTAQEDSLNVSSTLISEDSLNACGSFPEGEASSDLDHDDRILVNAGTYDLGADKSDRSSNAPVFALSCYDIPGDSRRSTTTEIMSGGGKNGDGSYHTSGNSDSVPAHLANLYNLNVYGELSPNSELQTTETGTDYNTRGIESTPTVNIDSSERPNPTTYHPCQTLAIDPSPLVAVDGSVTKRSSLRPLILPMRLASRARLAKGDPNTPPIDNIDHTVSSRKEGCLLTSDFRAPDDLNDIIALLDHPRVFNDYLQINEGSRDDESLITQLYAI